MDEKVIRSSRTRMKPLQYWNNERIHYDLKGDISFIEKSLAPKIDIAQIPSTWADSSVKSQNKRNSGTCTSPFKKPVKPLKKLKANENLPSNKDTGTGISKGKHNVTYSMKNCSILVKDINRNFETASTFSVSILTTEKTIRKNDTAEKLMKSQKTPKTITPASKLNGKTKKRLSQTLPADSRKSLTKKSALNNRLTSFLQQNKVLTFTPRTRSARRKVNDTLLIPKLNNSHRKSIEPAKTKNSRKSKHEVKKVYANQGSTGTDEVWKSTIALPPSKTKNNINGQNIPSVNEEENSVKTLNKLKENVEISSVRQNSTALMFNSSDMLSMCKSALDDRIEKNKNSRKRNTAKSKKLSAITEENFKNFDDIGSSLNLEEPVDIAHLNKSSLDKCIFKLKSMAVFTNDRKETCFMERGPYHSELGIQTGFLFVQSPTFHWGFISLPREIFVILGNGEMEYKVESKNLTVKQPLNEGVHYLISPGGELLIRRHGDSLLKLFVIYQCSGNDK